MDDDAENAKQLEEQSYSGRSASNALGETLSQIDAANNNRNTQYSVSGYVSQTTLQLSGEAAKILVHHRIYRATGQLREETLGNGVKLYYTYEPDTQRLKEKQATRLSDNQLLQSLQYSYDPVGNILSIEDQAQETEFYKNAKADPSSHYVYDSLYQLIAADGVESEQASCETSRLPHAISFGNNDASRLVNYQRNYDYDAGGNLFEITHRGASTCTQKLSIDTHSNRGIEKRSSGPTLQESFDANGNLLYLNIGKPLRWDNRNQLQETIQVERTDTLSDKEIYLYDGSGMRVQKTRIYLAETQIHIERVRYLSGLELRDYWQTDLQGQNKRIIEILHLISAQAGDVPVKVLHWELGKPNEIENNSFYYSLSDHIGSNQIELNSTAEITSFESYYPYGGTAIWTTKNQIESSYKYHRYSGKERDHSGLYYYGYRYYIPWLGRWLNSDPSGTDDGLNLFRMTRNNPITFVDDNGKLPTGFELQKQVAMEQLYLREALHQLVPQELLKELVPREVWELAEGRQQSPPAESLWVSEQPPEIQAQIYERLQSQWDNSQFWLMQVPLPSVFDLMDRLHLWLQGTSRQRLEGPRPQLPRPQLLQILAARELKVEERNKVKVQLPPLTQLQLSLQKHQEQLPQKLRQPQHRQRLLQPLHPPEWISMWALTVTMLWQVLLTVGLVLVQQLIMQQQQWSRQQQRQILQVAFKLAIPLSLIGGWLGKWVNNPNRRQQRQIQQQQQGILQQLRRDNSYLRKVLGMLSKPERNFLSKL
jgi:RHS repeat-associated protein